MIKTFLFLSLTSLPLPPFLVYPLLCLSPSPLLPQCRHTWMARHHLSVCSDGSTLSNLGSREVAGMIRRTRYILQDCNTTVALGSYFCPLLGLYIALILSLSLIFNPCRHAYAARVIVVGLCVCVCVSVCLSVVCLFTRNRSRSEGEMRISL